MSAMISQYLLPHFVSKGDIDKKNCTPLCWLGDLCNILGTEPLKSSQNCRHMVSETCQEDRPLKRAAFVGGSQIDCLSLALLPYAT